MIGVIANPAEHQVVCEFFELFKTPWEFYRSDRHYEVLLCTADGNFDKNTPRAVLIYAGQEHPSDAEENIQIASRRSNSSLSYKGSRIPIYGDSITFRGSGTGALVDEDSGQEAMQQLRSRGTVVARIGYDLFCEIRTLLTKGQPAGNASIPTLELHIALLRDLIVGSGVPLVEIPPVPRGYQFIACLTHDVDHPLIRQHKFDHTMFGFLYRATLGSLISAFRGRRSVRELLNNLWAALKLPLVHLGFAKDLWAEFERYTQLEKGLRSSFFVIPFKNRPGRNGRGPAPSRRAARYGAAEISTQIQKLKSAGCEIGLHGIDAWCDSSSGREELEQIRRITGKQDIGIRMHWLYFDEGSPATLEESGAAYDSSIGYNETVGYRAGTMQVYKPLGADRLLELPLHIMDTALFFPDYLALSPKEARERISGIIDDAVRLGGCVTVNWHDRSIAPERLWGDIYENLIEELKSRGAWLATAGETVSWFRKRRSAAFGNAGDPANAPDVKTAVDSGENLPGLCLQVHTPGEAPRDTEISAAGSEHTRLLLNTK
jgi:peptidoglycan/xylan/chitin deacetylase (PgdA/CDA1 family)